jgi:hypothetical protein
MRSIFEITSDRASNENRSAARRGKLDVISAAILTGGPSGGWGMARAFRAQSAPEPRFPSPQDLHIAGSGSATDRQAA